MTYGSHNKAHNKPKRAKHKKSSNVTKAAEGVKTEYDGFVGQRKAYRMTGKVVE